MAKKLFYRNYAVHINDSPVEIQETEELIAVLQAEENLSRHQALLRIFKAGKRKLIEDREYDRPNFRILGALGKLYATAKTEAAKKRGFAELYRELGHVKFKELAEEAGVIWEEVWDDFKELLPPPSRSDVMQEWIRGFLSDGAEHAAKEITEAAVLEGILTDPKENIKEHNRDLNLLRKVANGMNVSGGERGKWQQPREYIN